MFCLNETNRFVLCRQSTDMRKGPNRLCGLIRQSGLDPANGDVYVFIGASRHILKLLVWENGGYAVYYKRLEMGRISPAVFHDGGGGFRALSWEDLVLFLMGISPKTRRRKRYVGPVSAAVPESSPEGARETEKKIKNNPRNIWLSR